MTLIKQRHNWDCSIASVAMMTGLRYASILNHFKLIYPKSYALKAGLTTGEIKGLLRQFGMKPYETDVVHWGVEGILELPSLNSDGGRHSCYFSGGQVFDPNEGRRGIKFYPRVMSEFPICTTITVNLYSSMTKTIIEKWINERNFQMKTIVKDKIDYINLDSIH